MNTARQLRCYMNWMALASFPQSSSGWRATFDEKLALLRESGFDGVQFAEPATHDELAACRKLALGVAASGRVNAAAEADVLAQRAATDGYECVTLHVGWGLEDDREAAALIESILEASQRHHIPLYIETHRATVCQDMWRSVQFVKQFPEMRFNGDFSHWYAGQEMVYGGFDRKLQFIAPVLERVRFLHGRMANPGCIQVPVGEGNEIYVDHFRRLWTESFRGFLRSSDPQQHICFTPELLAPDIFYARTFHQQEESDRWEQSLVLKGIAQACFANAQFC